MGSKLWGFLVCKRRESVSKEGMPLSGQCLLSGGLEDSLCDKVGFCQSLSTRCNCTDKQGEELDFATDWLSQVLEFC